MILCDTNIFIELYKGNPHIASIVEHIRQQNLIAVSDVICAELFFGAKNKNELQFIHKDLNKLTILPIQENISKLAVELVSKYCLSHKLTFHDALIAATAVYHNIELYTLNIKDFIFLSQIKLFYP